MAHFAGGLQAHSHLQSSAGTVRLAAFSRVSTDSIDDAMDGIGRIFCPHDLSPVHRTSADFYAQHNTAAFDGVSVNYVSYGGSVAIDPGCLESFFLLQIPIAGAAQISTASCQIESAPGVAASVLSPTIPTRMIWERDCAKLILLIERRLVEQRAAALAGTVSRAVEFDPAIDLDTQGGRTLQAQVAHLADLAESLGPQRRCTPVAAAVIRESILDTLLNGQRHSLSNSIEVFSGGAEALPLNLKRARDCLHAQTCEPLDLEQLAQAAGVGIRALQLGFRRYFGTSISGMLQDLRLAHLNARLKIARPGENITDIAFDLGFTHLSRMANVYRIKFGEAPSDTLRKLS